MIGIVAKPACKRRVAERALQDEAEEEEHGGKRAVQQERDDVGPAEHTGAEDVEWDERIRSPLGEDEARQQRDAKERDDPQAFAQAERQRSE